MISSVMSVIVANSYLFVGVMCFLTGYVPSVSTEVILAGIGASVADKHVLLLAATGAAMQTLAKCHIYFLSKRAAQCLSFKSRRKIILLRRRFTKQETLSTSILFMSALIGIPPYYFMNIVCGLLNTGCLSFCVIGFLGMFIRFSACLAFPQILMG